MPLNSNLQNASGIEVVTEHYEMENQTGATSKMSINCYVKFTLCYLFTIWKFDEVKLQGSMFPTHEVKFNSDVSYFIYWRFCKTSSLRHFHLQQSY